MLKLKCHFKSVLAIFFAGSFSEYFTRRFRETDEGHESLKSYMVKLGLAWLVGLFWMGAVILAAYGTSYLGWWAWMWAPARQVVPPVWIFWLGDRTLFSFLIVACVAATPVLLTRRGGWMAALATIALFPGILSVPGFVFAILTERLVLWIRLLWRVRGTAEFPSTKIRVYLALAIWILFLFWGAESTDSLKGVLAQSSLYMPDVRLFLALLLMAAWTFVETVAAMVTFHFVYQSKCQSSLSLR